MKNIIGMKTFHGSQILKDSSTCYARIAVRQPAHVEFPMPHLVLCMGMPKIQVHLDKKLAKKLVKTSDELWPDQRARAVNRLARDAIRRYGRYVSGNPRARD